MNNLKRNQINIDGKLINEESPAYFIADVAANHDGDIERAKQLIYLAKEAGADAAKFQHFRAENIVSDVGFRALGDALSHQADWEGSVFEVYKSASVSTDWTQTLKETCDKAGITFFTSPYDFSLVDHIDPFVPAYKIGSGDITWIEIIKYIATKGKPYIIATGASSLEDVKRAVSAGLGINKQLALMQCNTNYTGSVENMRYVQLNVLKEYGKLFPDILLGLSDHTPGHATVLGAVTLGAKIIEKHFTDSVDRRGPDHKFSMDPRSWKDMVQRTRELEAALGNGVKRIEANEIETAVLQRRAIRSKKMLNKGHHLSADDLEVLRPCPADGIPPYMLESILGKTLNKAINLGAHLTFDDFND